MLYVWRFFRKLFISLSLMAMPVLAAIAGEIKEPATELTLQQALSLALNANPEIAVAMREREAIAGIKTQSAVRPNPSISTMIQDTRSATRETTLQVNQEFELGNKREARMQAADLFYSKAEAELENKQADIHANVIAAFYGVLAAQERLSLAKSSLEIANLALDAARKRVRAGKSPPIEETKSGIAASAAKIEVGQAAGQLASNRKRLTALWANALPVFEQAKGDITQMPEMPALNDLSARLQNSPAIKTAEIEINARAAATQVERSKSTPNITVSAGIVNNQDLGLNQALLGLSVPIPLFDRNQGNVQEALSRQYKAEDELALLKSQLELALANQYERLNTARQAAESLRNDILPGAQSAFEVANKGFSAGKFNFLDVLDAQRTWVQARSQYIQYVLEAHLATAEITRILGDITMHPVKNQE